MAYSETPYTAGAPAGERYDADPNVLTLVESSLTHPTHADGFVDVNDPCYVGDIVGVANESATAATDMIAMKVRGLFSLPVVASDDAGTSAITVGAKLFISSAGVISKSESGKFFGHALNTATASATATNICVWVGGTVDTLIRGLTDIEETLVASGAASTLGVTLLDGTSAAVAATLAVGANEGQRKVFRATNVANAVTLAVTGHEMGATTVTYTFAVVADYVILEWTGVDWAHIAGVGPVESATGTYTLSPKGATDLNSNAAAVTGTLGSGDYIGQIKVITMSVDASNSSTVSLTNHVTSDPEVATFDALDEVGVFVWTGTEWATVYATCTFV